MMSPSLSYQIMHKTYPQLVLPRVQHFKWATDWQEKTIRNFTKSLIYLVNMLKLMETQWLPTAGADRQHMASLLPLGSLRGTQLPETLHLGKVLLALKIYIAKFLLCHRLSKHGA